MNTEKALEIMREAVELCPGAEWGSAGSYLANRVAELEEAEKPRPMSEGGLLSWAHEKPEVGRLCLIYGRWDEEPVLCEMTPDGPSLARGGIDIEYGPMSCGDCDISLSLELKYGALWSYVPAVPDWDNMHGNELSKLLPDECKEGG